MRPISFPEQTVVIAKDQPEYLPLPAHVTREGLVICLWKLSIRERLKLMLTGKLWHSVLTFKSPLQPQRLSVDYPFQQPMGFAERDRREAELKERIRQFEDREKSFLAWAREQQRLASKSCKEWGEAGAKRQADYRNGMGYAYRDCENFFTGVDAAQRQQFGAELAKADSTDWKALVVLAEAARDEALNKRIQVELLVDKLLDDLKRTNAELDRLKAATVEREKVKLLVEALANCRETFEVFTQFAPCIERDQLGAKCNQLRDQCDSVLTTARTLGLLEDGK